MMLTSGVPHRYVEKELNAEGSLNLADNLTSLAERFDHLLALFPSSNRKVAFLEEILYFTASVQVLEKFTLHFLFRKSGPKLSKDWARCKGKKRLTAQGSA